MASVADITKAGGTALAVAGDVSAMATGQAIVDAAVTNWGSIDACVVLAGILRERMIFNMSEDEWDDVVRGAPQGHVHRVSRRIGNHAQARTVAAASSASRRVRRSARRRRPTTRRRRAASSA
jgi:NAD(P)-dependent dehydrogenase (short-subunit alcohol dehydrogenase family)